jgi:predicted P-loop ATPase
VTPKFKNIPVKRPRQVTFAMTINPEGGGYLHDPTGNVRFWPVLITALAFAALMRDRDLLWGEAVALYEAGMIPEPRSAEDKKLFGEEVSERQQSDIWETKIIGYVSEKAAVCIEEILEDCLKVEPKMQEQRDKLRVLDVLRSNGWSQSSKRGYVVDAEGKVDRPRMYVRPGEVAKPLEIGAAEAGALAILRTGAWKETVLPDGRRVWTQPKPEEALRDDV